MEPSAGPMRTGTNYQTGCRAMIQIDGAVQNEMREWSKMQSEESNLRPHDVEAEISGVIAATLPRHECS